jgi:two-component system sensor histidine kinase VicK
MKEIRFFQTIQVRLVIIYVLLILVAVQMIGVYFVRTLESSFIHSSSDSMNKQVFLLTTFVEPYLTAIQTGENGESERMLGELDSVVRNLNTISRAEIQIIDSGGRIMSTTSVKNQSIVGKRNTEIEVSRALQGIQYDSNTVVDEFGARHKVIAMPVSNEGKVVGVVYMIASLEDMYEDIKSINQILFSGTAIALALTALLGIVLAHTITSPIKEITKQANAMANGDFDRQVKVLGEDEIGQLGYTFNDMTNRLKDALAQNEEEKERLSSILINMSDGVVATDDTGKVIVMNVRARELLQLGDQTIMENRDLSTVLGMPKELLDPFLNGEEQATMLELAHSPELEPIRVRLVFTPIHRSGAVGGTVVVLRDVTEQEKLEQARREFVANVSHELRTPLTTIKSYMEALDDGALDDPSLSHKFISVVRGETERMIRLVGDLLHLSKLDSKKASLSKEWTNVYGLLEEVADRFAFQLQQKSIKIRVHSQIGLGQVFIDPDQIDQVLDNLVSNAIKYTGDGGYIELLAGRKGNNLVEISVKDTGFGIPKKDIAKIFDRFYRVDKARSRSMGGTGLGLSIAREIIKAHGGAVEIESDMGKGTKVMFTLPMGERGDS